MSISEMLERFGPEDARAVIAVLLILLVPFVLWMGYPEFAMAIFTSVVVLVAQYYYAKGSG